MKTEATPGGASAADDDDTETVSSLSSVGTSSGQAEPDEDGPESIEDLVDLGDLEDEDTLDADDALDVDDALDADEDALDDGDGLEVDDALDAVAVVPDAAGSKGAADATTEAETDDDELLADEVEASLDVILAERLRGEDTEADDDLEDDEDDAPNQLATVIPVRQPDEFLCQSCFLLKPPGQLADRDHQLCRDCA